MRRCQRHWDIKPGTLQPEVEHLNRCYVIRFPTERRKQHLKAGGEQRACLQSGLQALGVLEGQVQDGPKPLVEVFALLHEAPVALQEVLEKQGSDTQEVTRSQFADILIRRGKTVVLFRRCCTSLGAGRG